MISTIFSSIPKGVSIRRLDQDRNAQRQYKPYKFSAWKDGVKGPVYGNSIKEVVEKLDQKIATIIQ